ncbi:MAG: hypothetical protein JZU62_09970, partial [Sulfuricurvum sp.]|uniref:beta strand repeat-containing protein n=1 Tax=Sulfuricurvum sp. TaxID=2025608 RepID=UPI0025F793B1
SNITGIETINVNQSTTLTGTLNTTAVHIATGTTLTADASVVSAKVINNLTTNGTVAVTNLQGTLAADLSTITTTTIGATWSGSSATFTGNLGNASLAVTGGVMTTTDEILSGHTVTGSGALIVNVDSDLAFNWSNINSTVNETVNFSAGMTYAQNLSSADALTLASGVTVDISGATINGAITTSVTGAAGSESLTLNSSFLHATSSIDLAASADTLAITSNTALSAADFGKIHGVETLNLTNYTGTADLTSTDVNEITTLQTGSNVNSITIDYAMNVTDTGGTDTLTLAANSIDLSGKTITGIETLALGATTGTTLNATEASSMNITGSGTNAFSISDSGGADSVNLASDLSGFSGTFSFNGGTGNDNMTLDFTKLGSLTMDGGADTDTLALSGLSGSHITAANMSNISNVETVDISSIDLSSASLTIDFNALWNLGLTSDLAQTGGYNTINLDVLGTDTTNLSIAGMTSPAFITTTGAYDITDGTNTLHMIVA